MNKPFTGMAFCCTSIPSQLREDLAQKITSMGGIHYSDLMSDVNYLIVGDRKTDKYNYCIKYRDDIKFIRSEAIMKIFEMWLKGEESRELLNIDNYLMPIFDGLVVCMSRIDKDGLQDILFEEPFRKDHRKSSLISPLDVYNSAVLCKLIESHGGKFTESLTISNSCVITTAKKGKRYSKALEWGIPVIHPIWVYDALLRQATLKFEDYELKENFAYNQGCNVWNKLLTSMERTNFATTRNSTTDIVVPRKKLGTNPEIWNSIMSSNHTKTDKSNASRSLWDEMIDEDDQDRTKNQFKSAHSYTSINQNEHPIISKKKIFEETSFYILGFLESQESILKKVILTNGGKISSGVEDEEAITYIIVPVTKSNEMNVLLDTLTPKIKQFIKWGKIEVITEWFIERSVFYERKQLDTWGRPLKGLPKTSVNDFRLTNNDLNSKFGSIRQISITGFTGIELLHIQKLIGFLGFEFQETFNNKRDILIVNINLFKNAVSGKSPELLNYKYKDIVDCPVYKGDVSFVSSKNKINAAKNWGIPVVSLAYLWELMENSIIRSSEAVIITDPRWCVFAPKLYGKNKRSRSECELSDLRQKTPNYIGNDKRENSLPQLPSPRKSKKQKFGRLSGRSPEKIKPQRTTETLSQEKNIHLDEELFTVGYESEQVQFENPQSDTNSNK